MDAAVAPCNGDEGQAVGVGGLAVFAAVADVDGFFSGDSLVGQQAANHRGLVGQAWCKQIKGVDVGEKACQPRCSRPGGWGGCACWWRWTGSSRHPRGWRVRCRLRHRRQWPCSLGVVAGLEGVGEAAGQGPRHRCPKGASGSPEGGGPMMVSSMLRTGVMPVWVKASRKLARMAGGVNEGASSRSKRMCVASHGEGEAIEWTRLSPARYICVPRLMPHRYGYRRSEPCR